MKISRKSYKRKTILIIGASILQLPAIIKAKEMGFRVVVVDYNPAAVGTSYADEYYNVSTIDQEGILQVAKKIKPAGIMTLATDMPMRSIAYVAEKLNLPSITMSTAVKATDKLEMIKAFKENRVASPWYSVIDSSEELHNIVDKITFPCIMKPVDNSGSRGVVLINNSEELKTNYGYSLQNSRNGQVIVEEYLKGKEVSVEVIAYKGKVNMLAVTDKITSGAPHFVELGHSQPSQLPDNEIKAIHKLTEQAVKAIGLESGPAHVEMMVTDEGPKMIEIGARMGGDCITTHLVPLSTGIDMVKATIQIAVGEKPDISPIFEKGSAIRYFEVKPGVIADIQGIEEAKKINGVKDIVFIKNIGDVVIPIQSSTDRIGYVIAQGENAKEAVELCDKVMKIVKILTK
jgi:biotin carboxylase